MPDPFGGDESRLQDEIELERLDEIIEAVSEDGTTWEYIFNIRKLECRRWDKTRARWK
jgi:hypothetical protein